MRFKKRTRKRDTDVVGDRAGVEVPTSTAAYFEYSDDGCVTDVSDARAAIEAGDYALIAPATEEGEGDKFYLSSKILASGTNEFFAREDEQCRGSRVPEG